MLNALTMLEDIIALVILDSMVMDLIVPVRSSLSVIDFRVPNKSIQISTNVWDKRTAIRTLPALMLLDIILVHASQDFTEMDLIAPVSFIASH